MTGTVHHRLGPAPRQQRFSARRSTKTRPRRPPALAKEQSTLTQLDFVGSSSPFEQRNVYSVPTDDDEQYAAPRPKKKQKKNGRDSRCISRDQSTMTQHWRNPTFAKSGVVSDDDDVTVVGDSDGDMHHAGEDDEGLPGGDNDQIKDIRKAKLETQDQALLLSDQIGDDSDPEDEDYKDPVTSHTGRAPATPHDSGYISCPAHDTRSLRKAAASKSFSLHEDDDSEASTGPTRIQHPALITSFQHGENSTRPTTASSATNPKTPQKHWRSEVPSTETPSSLKLSASDTPQNEIYQRSPLKERSCNTSPLKQSQSIEQENNAEDCENGTFVLPERMSGPAGSYLPPAALTNKLIFTPKKDFKQSARTLTRKTTIQDSEDGSIELSSPSRSTRTLKHAATVQESQAQTEGVDLMNEPDIETYNVNGDFYEDEDEQQYTYMQQNTYDPVAAALDRDAAKFGKTATQLRNQTQHYFLDRTYEDDDDVEYEVLEMNDAEMLKASVAGQDTKIVESSQAGDRHRVPSLELGESPVKLSGPMTNLLNREEDVNGVDVIESSHPDEEDIVYSSQNLNKVPMSPKPPLEPMELGPADEDLAELPAMPMVAAAESGRSQIPALPTQRSQSRTQTEFRGTVPRPSQVSTVVPSQSSQSNSAHGLPPTSPQRSGPQRFPDTLSSSPFPLPPWSNDDSFPRRNLETQGTLNDFSLPPPPPLLSSSSRVESVDGL